MPIGPAMKLTAVASALAIFASVSVAHAQHGGHGGGHSGGSHSGGSHSSGSGHSHSGGAHSGGGHSTGTATARGGGSAHGSGTSGGSTANGRANADPAPAPHGRPRDGRDPVGTAVPRGSVPTTPPAYVVNARFTPFLYYSSFWRGPYHGSLFGFYGGGYVDPWYGYYDPSYGPSPSYAWDAAQSPLDEGALRLKIKPAGAQVFVDGYYVGLVDDFNGVFQKLHLASGPHRIEVRADGYEPLDFDVQILPNRKLTYSGELKRFH